VHNSFVEILGLRESLRFQFHSASALFFVGTPVCRLRCLRDWQRVQDLLRQWEADGKLSEKPAPLTVAEGCDKFIADAEAQNLREPTLYKYRLLFRQLQDFGSANRLPFIMDFDIDWVRRFPLFLEKQEYCRAQEARSVPRVLPVRA